MWGNIWLALSYRPHKNECLHTSCKQEVVRREKKGILKILILALFTLSSIYLIRKSFKRRNWRKKEKGVCHWKEMEWIDLKMNKKTYYYRNESNDRKADWMWKTHFLFSFISTSHNREQNVRINRLYELFSRPQYVKKTTNMENSFIYANWICFSFKFKIELYIHKIIFKSIDINKT